MALIARWRFEPGALGTDSVGGNEMQVNGSAAVDTWRIEGQGSLSNVEATTDFLNRTDANLDAGMPCKSGDASPLKTFTFCSWLRWNNTVYTDRGIINKYSATDAEKAFKIGLNASRQIYFVAWDGTQEHTVVTNTYQLTQSVPLWFAVSYRDSDEYCAIRIRDLYGNVLGTDIDAAVAGTWVGIQAGTANLTIGANVGAGGRMTANMDDTRCYNEYLTAAQATQICRQSSGLAGRRLMMGG